MADTRNFPTIEQLFGKLRAETGKLSASDIADLVNGWNHAKPVTYQANADLTYENFSGPEREAFNAAQRKIRQVSREEFLDEGGFGAGRIKSVFGLTPRDATKLVLKGRF